MPQEVMTIPGDIQTPWMAFKQKHPEISLKIFYRVRYCGLGDRKQLGGMGHTALLCSSDEVLQLSQRKSQK
ncbi:hypothetical protein D515_03075 [Grimontia indica]|uniref:Uncharacterized protein n=1 Tax=Grimontia indica TaxID=1056512 RepID=R1ILC7_9GAMM|nr:hypothetical protein D515_03075 [Grimontia indica]